MKHFKPSLSIALVLATTLFWVSCQKETSNQPLQNESKLSGRTLSDLVAFDPSQLSNVPFIVSADYLKNSAQDLQAGVTGSRFVKDNQNPVVVITSPTNGSQVSGTINVAVNTTDNVGVKSVSLSVDSKVVSTSTSAPFTNSWNSGLLPNGSHNLTVTAADAAGNKATNSITITVYNVSGSDITSPTVSITSPADGAKFDPNISVAINASASDNVGVTSVSFSVDGSVKGTSTTSPYTYSLNTGSIASGAHTITATAKDAAGNQKAMSISISINTTVVNPPALPSSYSLVMPPVVNQGSEGACIAFAVVYQRSYEAYKRTNATSYSQSTNILSPEYLFNQTKSSTTCSGSALLTSLNFVRDNGICTWSSMPYTWTGCATMPNAQQTTEAANYRIASYSQIYATDITAIKTMIAANRPVVSQYTVDNDFYNAGPGFIWKTFTGAVGSHALTICGYNDAKNAFLVINQWGTGWGDAGYTWIDYNFLSTVSSNLFVMNF
jgi:hypothetical protein